jgi:hypothetical protein
MMKIAFKFLKNQNCFGVLEKMEKDKKLLSIEVFLHNALN